MEFTEVVKIVILAKSTMESRFRKNSWTLFCRRAALRRLLKPAGQRIYVVQSAEGLAKIDELTPCRYGAPTVLVVAFDKTACLSTRVREANSGVEG